MSLFSSNINRAYLFKFLVSFHLIGGVLVPFFTDWGGLTLSQTLLLQSWFLVWSLLLEIPTGAVADYVGRKQSLFLGALLWGIGTLVYSSFPNLVIFLLAEFILALAVALYSGADEAFLYDSLKTEGKETHIQTVLSRYDSAKLIGLMLAAPLGSIIGSQFGPRFSMMLTSIPMFLAFAVGLTFREPPKRKKIHESTRYLDVLKQGVSIFIRRRKIQWIALDLAVVSSLSFMMIWLYQPLLLSLGLSLAMLGFIHAANAGIQVITINSYSWLEKRLNVERLLMSTAILPGLLFIVAGSVKQLPVVIAAIVLTLGFGLTRRPLVSEELNRVIPSHQRATIISSVILVSQLFRAILNPIVGKLADWSVQYTLVLIGVTLLCFSVFRYTVVALHSKGRI